MGYLNPAELIVSPLSPLSLSLPLSTSSSPPSLPPSPPFSSSLSIVISYLPSPRHHLFFHPDVKDNAKVREREPGLSTSASRRGRRSEKGGRDRARVAAGGHWMWSERVQCGRSLLAGARTICADMRMDPSSHNLTLSSFSSYSPTSHVLLLTPTPRPSLHPVTTVGGKEGHRRHRLRHHRRKRPQRNEPCQGRRPRRVGRVGRKSRALAERALAGLYRAR